ncbi:MAG: hypothetical protein IKU76_08620 [Bacteroidaceae bacterium]|nr:hypothetical protein [Bacteroidaceae bacterium]
MKYKKDFFTLRSKTGLSVPVDVINPPEQISLVALFMSSECETSLSSLLFAFGELALARHNQNKFGPALAYPQLCSVLSFEIPRRYALSDEHCWVNIYIIAFFYIHRSRHSREAMLDLNGEILY